MIEPRLRGRDKPQGPVGLRRDAEKIAGALPPLLAQAEFEASVYKLAVWRAMLAAAKLQGDLKLFLQQASK